MKDILLKRQLELKAKLKELELRASADDVSAAELEQINIEVSEVSSDLTETNEALTTLDEDPADPEPDPIDETEDPSDPEPNPVDPDQRKKALEAIKRGLSAEPDKNGGKKKRSGFLQYVAGKIGKQQARTLGVEFNNGRVLVPKDITHDLISYAEEQNPIRKYATIHKTKGILGFPIQVAKMTANNPKTERTEANKIPFTDIEFDDYFLNPTEIDALTKVTKKITHMSDFDVEAIVLEELKKAYVRKEVYLHIHDTANPGSIVKKVVAFTATGDNDYLKLVQLKNVLPTSLRSGARWFMNRAAQTEVESMLDKNGNPILKDSGNDDFDYKLFNYPVEVSDHFDDPTAPEKPILYFGNMAFFHIQDVIGALEIQVLYEKYSDENKIGYKIYNLSDGQLVYGPFETPLYSLDLSAVAGG